MSLVKRIRGKIAPHLSELEQNTIPYKDALKKSREIGELVNSEFGPRTYQKFESLFTTDVPTGENGKALRDERGKVIRYSGTVPENVDKLIERLSYNSHDNPDVQVGKYIALLIGRREVAAMTNATDRCKRENLYKIIDAIKEKLVKYPFYKSEHIAAAQGMGRGYGHDGYMPPNELFHPPKLQRAA